MHRYLSALLLIALCGSSVPAHARYTVSCESHGYRYQYCSAHTDGHARLLNQTSSAPCVERRTWGYDNGGVWVNNGCGGEFEVGGSGSTGSAGAAVAAGVGLAILGAIIASNDRDGDDGYAPPHPYSPGYQSYPPGPLPHPGSSVPGWAVGSFYRTDGNRQQQTLRINPDGAVTFRSAGNRWDRGWFNGGVIDMGSYTMNVHPSRGGVVVDGAPFQRR
jgi:hypothetical protein